jgi:hypothetical protein
MSGAPVVAVVLVQEMALTGMVEALIMRLLVAADHLACTTRKLSQLHLAM